MSAGHHRGRRRLEEAHRRQRGHIEEAQVLHAAQQLCAADGGSAVHPEPGLEGGGGQCRPPGQAHEDGGLHHPASAVDHDGAGRCPLWQGEAGPPADLDVTGRGRCK